MKRASPRSGIGASVLRALLLFKMFELLVVVLVLSLLYYTVIDRAMEYRAQYEDAEVSWTIATIHTARKTEIATDTIYRALGKENLFAVEKPRSSNPMHLLDPTPHNYVGELCDPDPRTLSGSWYFDRCNKVLVYVYTNEKFFARGHPKMLRFNVESLHLLTDPA